MLLRPLNDALIVEPDTEEFVDLDPKIVEILKSGIIEIPEKYLGAYKKIAMRGKVVSYGNNCKYDYKVGDRVVFGRFCGASFFIKDKKYLFLREYELLAKEENED